MYDNTVVKDWKGILPIISVPFYENEEVDYEGFKKTIDYIDGLDVLGMVLFGIASEFYKLSDNEKSILVSEFIKTPTKCKKIISITDHSTILAEKKAMEYESLGVDAIMLLPPFFLNPTKEQILSHISKVASSVAIPIILQIASGETGVSYSKEEIITLHKKFKHIIFKIEGSPAPTDLIRSIIKEAPQAVIFNGYAGIYMIEMLDAGCKGIMPGCSFINVYLDIYKLYFSDYTTAKTKHELLCTYINKWMASCEYIIQIEKNILMKKSIIASDKCRAPQHYLENVDYKDIKFFLNKYNKE